ncbi:MAG: sulfite exporter TauE/SafE family protein [Gemmatimonadales bacterium]
MPVGGWVLLPAAFFAGFIEATVGGGGLIQVTALMLVLGDATVPTLLGTAKLASVPGTAASVFIYTRRLELPRKIVFAGCLASLGAAILGAATASHIPRHLFDVVVILIVLALAASVVGRSSYGEWPPGTAASVRGGIASAGALGFYDAAIGPGSGVFMIGALVQFGRMNLLLATAVAKWFILTAATTALLIFLWTSPVLVGIALGMASFNILGSVIGARMAVARGNPWLRRLLLLVLAGLLARLAWRAVS